MIEIVQSKDQQYALKWLGKWICSSIAPLKEAADWVTAHTSQFNNIESVLVLGLGCAHHIVELKKSNPALRILVIEAYPEIIKASLKQYPLDIFESDVVCIDNENGVFDSERVRSFLSRPYTVLKFGPATSTNPAFYGKIEQHLSARTEFGFKMITSLRRDLAEHLGLDQLRLVGDEMISIKTIEQLTAGQSLNHWVHVARALREIVN